ncbi:MAG TPA: hypothetical protein VNX18_17400 [Bryobacteraceae bacterium]|nr:hypothetical protein [Bryobacteraceae bacterium]
MLSLIDRRPVEDDPLQTDESNRDEVRAIEPSSEPVAEFEIVMGRTQIASVSFLATVIIVAFSAMSYLAGKSSAPKPAPTPAPVQKIEAPVVQATVVGPTAPEPTPTKSVATKAVETKPEAPLFDNTKTGALYLQLGAVEKGVAIIMAQGLRKQGLDGFVAPGPNDHIFRVVIGPLNAESYTHARQAVEELGLSNFARKIPGDVSQSPVAGARGSVPHGVTEP